MARKARASDGSRIGLVKAHVLSTAGGPRSEIERHLASTEGKKTVEGLLEPPADVDKLIFLWSVSAHVPPNVAAMVTNVDSFGHRLEPAIDLDAPDADARVRAALTLERLHAAAQAAGLDIDAAPDADTRGATGAGGLAEDAVLPDPDRRLARLEQLAVADPTDADVARRKAALQRLARLEMARARSFFEFCCVGGSFISLRRRVRQDLEVTGNAWIEVLRNTAGLPARLIRAPVNQMYLAPVDADATRVEDLVRVSDLDWERVPQYRHFRRFAQVESGTVVAWYKEFGDPRAVSRKTGRAYADAAALAREEGREARAATEILHLTIPHPGSPYGAPRWLGNTPAVLGSRELDEDNLDFFQSNTIPPLAVVVSGGAMRRNVIGAFEDIFQNRVRGRGSTHKVVFLEAEPTRTGGGTFGHVPRIQFVPLREAQRQDATFQTYDERNADKIGASFRLPRILVGRDRAINRSVAEAAIRLAEDQVFAGERAEFDEVVNRQVLPALGITFWRFVSNAPTTHDAQSVAAVVGAFARAGAISANEARALASGLFNREFPPWPWRWANQPLPLTIAQLQQPELAARLMADALGDLTAMARAAGLEDAAEGAAGDTESTRGANGAAEHTPPAVPVGTPLAPLGDSEPDGAP